MNDKYILYRKYRSKAEVDYYNSILNENKIKTEIVDNIPSFDVSFSGNTFQNEIEIRIDPSNFDRANEILDQVAEETISHIDPDHYLLEFSDEELYEIILKADEWNEYDFTLAKTILIQRGKTIDKELLNSLKKQRLSDLSKPESKQNTWIVGGYFFACFGGIFGLMIGYMLWKSRKTLPNGEKFYSYSDVDRMHGKIIFIISSVMLPVMILYNVMSQLP